MCCDNFQRRILPWDVSFSDIATKDTTMQRSWRPLLYCATAVLSACGTVFAQEGTRTKEKDAAPTPTIAQAVARSLPVVQKAAANYPKNRDCFSCHHQTLPMLAMVEARSRGDAINTDLLREQAEFTRDTFIGRHDALREGTGVGGRAMTVAYALWALDLADYTADATTEAMSAYILKTQKPEGYWTFQTNRPPLEASSAMCTVLCVYGLQLYGTEGQKSEITSSIDKAKTWLAAAPLDSMEDKGARLWGAKLLGENADVLEKSRAALLADQRADGGWPQLSTMTSDAYATGQALFILAETGLPTSDAAYQRGVQFLLKTQGEDGSWLVETRSKPIQKFFDNGDPHGKHQFIVIPATSWALAALARSGQK